jgi:hypothetical protein
MTMVTENIGSVGTGGYAIDAGGDIGDLAFYIAAYQLQSLDGELCENMGRIKTIGEIKKAYRERLALIREWLESEKDGKVLVPADEAKKVCYESKGPGGAVEAVAGEPLDENADRYFLVDENGDRIKMPLFNRFEWRDGELIDTGRTGRTFVEAKGSQEHMQALSEHYPGSTVMVQLKKETLENEVSRLEGILGDLNSDGELQLLNINRLLSRRSQAMQLASNIMSSSHQTAMGIISNIK